MQYDDLAARRDKSLFVTHQELRNGVMVRRGICRWRVDIWYLACFCFFSIELRLRAEPRRGAGGKRTYEACCMHCARCDLLIVYQPAWHVKHGLLRR
jgi:hypothetical protein